MTVEFEWVRQNIPDVVGVPRRDDDVQSVARSRQLELIEFDSESPIGRALPGGLRWRASGGVHGTRRSFVDIDLARQPRAHPVGSRRRRGIRAAPGRRPHRDLDDGRGPRTLRVLTPGADSRDDWRPYTKNYDAIAADMRVGCPARNYHRLGTYWCTTIGDTSVTLFKSDSHMSQDGPALPNAKVWQQVISDVSPKWIITTGTGGGIGTRAQVGDVVLSRFVGFDCQREFKDLNGKKYSCAVHAPLEHLPTARSLFAANAGFLPPDNSRRPTTDTAQSSNRGILTTDFFGFDNSANTYGLQGKGDLSEMGDAVLGMVCAEAGDAAPNYVAVRNVSDPQISANGMTLPQQAQVAAEIYKTYGRWSTVCSAIVCWGIVAGV